jgi:hypothetical protein
VGKGAIRIRPNDLLPGSPLPLAYFAFAHAALATALGILVIDPGLPGGYFLHPRMVALVHLVTLGWISGSILGAFYIVAPLALGMPFAAGRADWTAWGAFVIGTIGMATHFWIGEYYGMVWSAAMVLSAIGWIGWRAFAALPDAPVPGAVALHVRLAFANIVAAGLLGSMLGLPRIRAIIGASPLSAVFAHAHLAAIGWALMMVIGLAYRLLPMILPAKPPPERGLAASALLLEGGLVLLVSSLLSGGWWLPVSALTIVAGLSSFVRSVRQVVAERLPRPPALPARDWSTWQVHGAFLALAVATLLGLSLTVAPAGSAQVTLAWIYGVVGLVGGLSQIVVGMQGRLVPMYAWYRAMAAGGGRRPGRSAHSLVSAPHARAIFVAWSVGVPWLAAGLATAQEASIRASALVLLAAVVLGAVYVRRMLRAAHGDRLD